MPLDFPANPTDGQVYPAAPNSEYIYSTSKGAWLSLPTESAKTVTSDNPPSNPKDGDQWFNTTDANLYIYYVDVDGGQWVQIKNDASFSSNIGPRVDALEIKSPNYVINGGFDIWQRGTSTTSNSAFLADRWGCYYDGTGTFTYSQQTFTPGAAPVAGYEGTYFARYASASSGTSTFAQLNTRLEDVRTLAGQTVTLSFFAKADSARTFTTYVEQYFGAGGSSTILANQTSHSVTTGWQRFTTTFTMPSISGKTITTGTYIQLTIRSTVSSSFNMDIWGVQFEAGAVSTPFRRNANSIQGELAACQRYFHQFDTTSFYSTGRPLSAVRWSSTSPIIAFINHPVPMRVAPSLTASKTGARFVGGGTTLTATFTPSSDTFIDANTATLGFSAAAASATAGWIDQFAVLQFSAEL